MRLLFLLVAFATVISSLRPIIGGRVKGGQGKHLHRDRSPYHLALVKEIEAEWIDQKLDHFDSAVTKTWKQRFFYNDEYTKDDSTVNLLYVSGEEIDDARYITGNDISYVYYAEQMSASLYTLEHRFYGKSYPTESTSTENLMYLSSRQAVEDIAEFIRQKNKEKGGNQKWIVVGGSYGGSVAAWSRLKHPELISGALASSAPIQAQMDFYGYLQKVDEVFKQFGGLCYSQLRDSFEEARRLLQSPAGRDKLSTLFKITPPFSAYDDISAYDTDVFYGYLTAEFETATQLNQPPVDKFCQDFTSHGPGYDPLQALADIDLYTEFNVNFTESVIELSEFEFGGDLSYRLWIYQTCTEFGFFQTTNRGSNVFGQDQSSNQYIEYCSQAFGISGDQVRKNVDATNKYYGGKDYFAGTNVLFSHGTQDPWSYLTKNDDPKHWSVVIVEVENGYHMQDIGQSCFAPTAKCTSNMKQIQQLTLENMKRWVDPLFPVPNSISIIDNVGQRPQFFDPNVFSPLPINANFPDAVIRAKRNVETPKISKRIDFNKWNKFTGKGRKVLLPPPDMTELAETSNSLGQDFIVQTWDHFNPNEERTFKQKWFYNYKFGSTDGPNFLMIGGEGPEDIAWVQSESLDWIKNAKEVGANVFLLEHRYYGESKLGTNDLQFLTSAQMLYDVATFIRTQQVKKSLSGPWITFGGSYPGALAAWSREWFPELIIGAVGSSGPVLAKNDFYEYLEVVEDVIKRHSQKCYDRTSEAFARLHKLSQEPAGRKTIQEKFNLIPAWSGADDEVIDELDMNEVFSNLYGLYQGTVQYNSLDWSDVAALCAPMEDDKYTDSLDALRAVQTAAYGNDNVQTLSSYDVDLQNIIAFKGLVDGHDPKVNDDVIAGVLWTWQTCNEFGYYQTTDYGGGIFGTPVPVNFFIVMCERVFGVGMGQVEKGISRTNYQYGGRDRYNTTNVVLPNGDADPWHALGIIEQGNLDPSIVPILIKGTSHCADMYGKSKNDPPELTAAREKILENIKKWLNPSPPFITTTQSSGCHSFVVSALTILLSITL